MAMTPASADKAGDIALAESFKKMIELGEESADAAIDRANAALVAVMSQNPEAGIAGSGNGINDCLTELRAKFQQDCSRDRD